MLTQREIEGIMRLLLSILSNENSGGRRGLLSEYKVPDPQTNLTQETEAQTGISEKT